jgi:hypothetical protein
MAEIEQEPHENQLGEDADGADHAEQSVADRDPLADQFVQQQLQVFEPHHEVELAMAVEAVAKRVANLLDANRTLGGGQQVDQDFETYATEAADHFIEVVAAQSEEAAHGVGDIGVADERA